jgi:hypothetical protein
MKHPEPSSPREHLHTAGAPLVEPGSNSSSASTRATPGASSTKPTSTSTACPSHHRRRTSPIHRHCCRHSPVRPRLPQLPKSVLAVVVLLSTTPPHLIAGMPRNRPAAAAQDAKGALPCFGYGAASPALASPALASPLAGPGRSHQATVACWHNAIFHLLRIFLNQFN